MYHLRSRNTPPKKTKFCVCEECGERFSSEAQVKIHQKKVHSTRSRKSTSSFRYPCSQCEEKFPSPDALKKHKKSQHSDFCPLCQKRFYNERLFETHQKNHFYNLEHSIKRIDNFRIKVECTDVGGQQIASIASTSGTVSGSNTNGPEGVASTSANSGFVITNMAKRKTIDSALAPLTLESPQKQELKSKSKEGKHSDAITAQNGENKPIKAIVKGRKSKASKALNTSSFPVVQNTQSEYENNNSPTFDNFQSNSSSFKSPIVKKPRQRKLKNLQDFSQLTGAPSATSNSVPISCSFLPPPSARVEPNKELSTTIQFAATQIQTNESRIDTKLKQPQKTKKRRKKSKNIKSNGITAQNDPIPSQLTRAPFVFEQSSATSTFMPISSFLSPPSARVEPNKELTTTIQLATAKIQTNESGIDTESQKSKSRRKKLKNIDSNGATAQNDLTQAIVMPRKSKAPKAVNTSTFPFVQDIETEPENHNSSTFDNFQSNSSSFKSSIVKKALKRKAKNSQDFSCQDSTYGTQAPFAIGPVSCTSNSMPISSSFIPPPSVRVDPSNQSLASTQFGKSQIQTNDLGIDTQLEQPKMTKSRRKKRKNIESNGITAQNDPTQATVMARKSKAPNAVNNLMSPFIQDIELDSNHSSNLDNFQSNSSSFKSPIVKKSDKRNSQNFSKLNQAPRSVEHPQNSLLFEETSSFSNFTPTIPYGDFHSMQPPLVEPIQQLAEFREVAPPREKFLCSLCSYSTTGPNPDSRMVKHFRKHHEHKEICFNILKTTVLTFQ